MPVTVQHYTSNSDLFNNMLPPHMVPSYPIPVHACYTTSYRWWRTARDLDEGEFRVKGRAEIYLPKLPSQTDTEYLAYLKRATYYNGVGVTMKGLQGSLFRVPPSLNFYTKGAVLPIKLAGENTPGTQADLTPQQMPTVNGLSPDDPLYSQINPNGISKDYLSFVNFSKKIARSVILTGRGGVLVDLPERSSAKPRPFCVFYEPENILNWRYTDTGDGLVIDQIILLESVEQREALGISEKQLYRILELINGVYTVSIYEPISSGGETGLLKRSEIVPTIRGVPLDFIPFQFFGPLMNTPEPNQLPLKDIVTLNLSHYRSYAELEHGRFYCGMPTYYVAGQGLTGPQPGMGGNDTESSVQRKSPYAVGPNNMWILGENDKCGILEFNGSGLAYLEAAVEGKQSQMASLGSKLLIQQRKTSGVASASVELANMGEQATLGDIASSLDEGMTNVINWMLRLASLDDRYRAEVSYNKDFEPADISAREMRAIQSLYETGVMSTTMLYSTFRDAGIVKSSVSIDEFEQMVKQRQTEKKTEEDRIASRDSNIRIEESKQAAKAAAANRPANKGTGF